MILKPFHTDYMFDAAGFEISTSLYSAVLLLGVPDHIVNIYFVKK